MQWPKPLLISFLGLLLQVHPPHPSEATGQMPSTSTDVPLRTCVGLVNARSRQIHCLKTPSCSDTSRSSCELALGQEYLQLGLIDDAAQHCAAALQASVSNIAAAACLRRAQDAIRSERIQDVSGRIGLIQSLIRLGAYSRAEDQLRGLMRDEEQATTKYGPLES